MNRFFKSRHKVVVMRRITALAFTLVLAPLAPAYATTLDYQGYAFKSGEPLPFVAGDFLRIPIVVDQAAADLGVDFGSEEMTGYISGLVANAPQDGGNGVVLVTFSDGRIDFYRDPSRDHDFGVGPPNSTVPSTFTNGTLCLGGTLSSFALFLDSESTSGAYEGSVTFDTGSCLATLHAARAEGFTFGGVLTRAAVGEALPAGYTMTVDGFLEAQKVPAPDCPVQCFGIESASFDFPKKPKHVFHDTDGKFRIEGEFIPCATFGELDPEGLEFRIQIGTYTEVLPVGSVREASDDDHDSECGDHGDGSCWVYSNPNAKGALTRFELQFERDEGEWDFEVRGRGIPKATLIGPSNQLVFVLNVDVMQATAEAQLVQKKNKLTLVHHHHDDACDPEDAIVRPGIGAPAPNDPARAASISEVGPLIARPNPMRDGTSIAFGLATAGETRLRIFDIRGRVVRTLQSGTLGAGLHRFAWDARDDRGTRVANGIYVYRMDSVERSETRKIVVAR